MEATMQATPMQRSPVRYRNHLRWRVMPPEGAAQQGFFDRSFENKEKALHYQKKVKARFPTEPCCLLDTGRWYDALGRIIP